ncbi:hypothetical protein NDU88_005014 [Pleurodeles waltl]|uniref:Uncharacterized protein n=1 Tax=Pleurodeles waltl TaxID=8319 RepID=A0AAV7TTN1_PLEWA|nr:hypothetical protein NDU88_005014 [Pleurodeles waltl]
MSLGAQRVRNSCSRPSMFPTWGRAAQVSASVFGFPGTGPPIHGAGPPRSHPFSAPPSAYAVSRLALPRACWVVCRPRAPLRQPRSVPAGRGRYAARPAISAGGRFPLRCGPVPRSAPLTNGGRHSCALDF